MSATIFTGWHLLTYGTATNIILVGAAVLVLRSKVRESRDYMAAGDAAFASAEQRDAAFEETRNKPWYWPTGPAIEADKPHDAEVLHVEYPTSEFHLHGETFTTPSGARIVQTEHPELLPLSDRPAEDEDEVGDEQPGEATADAPAKLWQRLREWWSAVWQSRRERNLFGSGEQATDVDPFEQFRIDDSPRGRCHPRTDAEIRAELAELTGELPALPLVLSPAEVAAIDEQRAQWVALNPPTNHGPDGQRHWNKATAMHGIVTPGRHAKMPINASIPTQRDGGDLDA